LVIHPYFILYYNFDVSAIIEVLARLILVKFSHNVLDVPNNVGIGTYNVHIRCILDQIGIYSYCAKIRRDGWDFGMNSRA